MANLMAKACNPARIPVIIGVGQVNDRPADPTSGLDSIGLMLAALAQAGKNAGVQLLERIEWLGVEDQISFPDPDILERVAAQLPARPARLYKTEEASGDGPVRMINEAANLIAAGEIRMAAAVGGEAMRTAGKRAQAEAARAAAAGETAPKSHSLADAAAALAKPLHRRYGLLTPIDVYPLYENATRTAWGQSAAEAQQETAEIWSGFSRTAADNPHAWLRTALPPADIAQVSADNRMLAYPYTKLMVANSSVNQGAAVILASLQIARDLGISEERLIYVGAGAASHEPDDFLCRDSYDHSASLTATIAKTLEFNRIEAEQIDHVELYSCFPCVPKMARRVLGWPLDRPHSVYGGLTFGGGPIGNCMMHAAAAMVEKLRAGGRHGLIVANGGYATHNHAIVLSRDPAVAASLPQVFDVQGAAEALRGPVPRLLEGYSGPAAIETFTAPFGRTGEPLSATIVGRTLEGDRFLAAVGAEEQAFLTALVSGQHEFVGTAGHAEWAEDGRVRWKA